MAVAPIAAAQVVASAKQTVPTPADLMFFADGARRTAYELKMAEMAADKASSDKIRHYAEIVADDDRAYLQALRELAQQCYVNLSTPLSDDEEERIEALHERNGTSFDRAYAEAATEAADADTQLSDYEEATTFNPHIRDLIVKYKQIRELHQEQAK